MDTIFLTNVLPILIALIQWATLRDVVINMPPAAQHPDPATEAALQQLLARLDAREKSAVAAYEETALILRMWAKQTRVDQPERVMAVAQALASVAETTQGIVSEEARSMAARLVRAAQGVDEEETTTAG